MIKLENVQKLIDTSAALADAVDRHLKEIPSDTEMTLAVHELRLAQADFDNELFRILEELSKENDLTFTEEDGKIKTRH